MERRKSRRHSTGNSPHGPPPTTAPPPPPPPLPKLYATAATTQQTVDEDSSSSANSAEPNDVFGVVLKTNREGAGVTPGLIRRRERAERQKTFMREQQEAAAAGLRPFDSAEDVNGHGELYEFCFCVDILSFYYSDICLSFSLLFITITKNNNLIEMCFVFVL